MEAEPRFAYRPDAAGDVDDLDSQERHLEHDCSRGAARIERSPFFQLPLLFRIRIRDDPGRADHGHVAGRALVELIESHARIMLDLPHCSPTPGEAPPKR